MFTKDALFSNFFGSLQSENAPRENDIALLLHTSGTTSKPKLVPLTHQNMMTSINNIINAYNLTEVLLFLSKLNEFSIDEKQIISSFY
jgi:long-subunit acyl-CoA synthetase (AMP-forming)